ncbi:D-alanyl-D-alanine carboxypeptidase family protein [Herbiconiux sp. P18]|uniref:D-alanyl-D-alanine carboxypeptidase family protein n=1 Tax=Herbiconiux liangxiaofengii TaxID=3342795 RepID=UPI0035B71E87
MRRTAGRPRTTGPAAPAATLALVVAIVLTGCTAPDAGPGSASGAPGTAPIASAAAAAVTTNAPVFPPTAPAALALPETGQGVGAVGIAAADGSVELLGQSEPATTTPVPIASITKVITSLVVLDAHPLAPAADDGTADQGPTITLTQSDLDVTAEVEAQGQFTEPMRVGQQVSLHDALAITLLTSANNYAETAARWAFGSQEAFLAAARTWLDAHSLTATTLADASGLNPGSASTPTDLLRVASLAHANPALLAITGQSSQQQADLGTIANQNILLDEDGVDGLKTGSTGYAGFTLLTSAVVPVGSSSATLVAVVLGTPSLDARFASTRALLASARAGLSELVLAQAGQSFGGYTASSGEVVQAVARDARTATVFAGTPVTASVTLSERSSGVAGEVVGSAAFTLGATTVEVPLVLASNLKG